MIYMIYMIYMIDFNVEYECVLKVNILFYLNCCYLILYILY